jgi:hypothetical protein
VLLADAAAELRQAGLHRLTVSLDTLRADRFLALARRDSLPAVFAGIDGARTAGFTDLKIDSVITRGDNDDELADLLEYGRSVGAEVRFIEYMDVGGATRWRPEAVVSRAECSVATGGSVRPDPALAESAVGARGSLSPARRSRVRHHRVDDTALLPDVRPRPADGRRRPAAVPLRPARHGPSPPAARRGLA